MIDTCDVIGLFDKDGVQVRNNDIIRIRTLDCDMVRYGRIGFGVFEDDNTGENHIGFYVKSEGHTVTAGQLVGYSDQFKVVGNRLNYIYAKRRGK